MAHFAFSDLFHKPRLPFKAYLVLAAGDLVLSVDLFPLSFACLPQLSSPPLAHLHCPCIILWRQSSIKNRTNKELLIATSWRWAAMFSIRRRLCPRRLRPLTALFPTVLWAHSPVCLVPPDAAFHTSRRVRIGRAPAVWPGPLLM